MPGQMGGVSRRGLLKIGGSVLGGIAVGSEVVAAEKTDRYIVTTKRSALDGFEVVHEMPGVDVAVVRGSADDLKRSKAVRSFAPDTEIQLDLPRAEPASLPGDASPADEPLYPFQWDKQIQDLPSVHETTQGEGTRVTVIDTGIPETHPDLRGPLNVDLSRNFTGDGGNHEPRGLEYHGTHVGGIVAGADNGTGMIGTAPETDLVDCRVFTATGGSRFSDFLAAITYSANIGADAANLSLGAYPVSRKGLGRFYGKVLNTVTTYANSEGTLVVTSAGNDAADLQHDGSVIALPTEAAQTVTVSATTSIGFDPVTGEADNPGFAPAGYTNYGTNAITVGAPGGDVPPGGSFRDLVLSAIPERVADFFFGENAAPYAYLSGTSMAAPQVTGAAALLKSANPNYNANRIESAVKRTAAVPSGFDKAFYGSGFLDLQGAVGGGGRGTGRGHGKSRGSGRGRARGRGN